MQVLIGPAPVALVSRGNNVTPVVQNLGPGDLYLGYDNTVSASNGFKVPSGSTYEFPRDTQHPLYAIATQANTDVRVLTIG